MSQTLSMIHSESPNLSMDNNENFFEGVEKLLEVWFTRKDGMTSNCDLRNIPRTQLEMTLQLVKCEIISMSSSEDLDAYVLSESSMFISNRRFILKTCGTTATLLCLPLLISLAKEYAGYDVVKDLYYSRKNFKRPDLQSTPHRSFDEEIAVLDEIFPGRGGRAYCMGSMTAGDCWYLYTVSPRKSQCMILADRQNVMHNSAGKDLISYKSSRLGKLRNEPDQTLEVLMTNVDQKKMRYYYKENCPTAAEATKLSGIDSLIPGLVIDDYQFSPCGYSMNGLSRSVPGGYMTIHITPEPHFSYVSFETNIPHKSYKDLIERVINTFSPQEFIITFFSSRKQNGILGLDGDTNDVPEYADYDVEDIQICRLQGYDLTYALYNRFPS